MERVMLGVQVDRIRNVEIRQHVEDLVYKSPGWSREGQDAWQQTDKDIHQMISSSTQWSDDIVNYPGRQRMRLAQYQKKWRAEEEACTQQ